MNVTRLLPPGWPPAHLRKPLLIGAAALPVLLIALWFIFPAKPADIGATRTGPITVAVFGTVRVEPVQQVLVRSRNNGSIQNILVSEGQQVEKDAVLADIRDEQDSNDLTEAEVQLAAAQDRLKIGAQSANELEAKKNELVQLARLLKEGNIAPIEFERMKSLVDDLETRVAQEKLNLEKEVSLARQRVQTIVTRVQMGQVRSPIAGQVLNVYAQLGAAVLNQSQLFLIGSKETQLRASVNEEDVGKVKIGMPAEVKLFSFPGRTFAASVSDILPQGDNQSYIIILKLEKEDKSFLPGMTGESNIIVGNRPDALLIPTRALRNGNQVYRVKSGRVSIQEVKVGYRSVEISEILEGLQEGDQVILSDHDLFQNGDRVRRKPKS